MYSVFSPFSFNQTAPFFQFDEVGAFSKGLALAGYEARWAEFSDARTQVYLFGYVNKAGEFVIPPKYLEAKEFKDGMAAVSY
ncbi:MAG: WG repeat-containing protein [Candidatus Obscuribacterales bacterium]|nr:WG repeat-containing protein [Candidatus Obscuribacterales bacterium]